MSSVLKKVRFNNPKEALDQIGNFRKQLGWLIKEAPDGVRMTITPEMAEVMMERNKSDEWANRPRSATALKRFVRTISEGRWAYTGETVVFSITGRLLNGQHRLTACIQAGAPIETLVAFGVDDAAFKFMDIGVKRTAGHILAIEGVPNYHWAAAALRIIYAYSSNPIWSGAPGGFMPENDELLEFYYAHNDINKSRSAARSMWNEKLLTPAWAGALHYICAQKNRQQADGFFETVASGIGIKSKQSPEYLIRSRLTESAIAVGNKKTDDVALAALFIKAWNAARGNPTKVLRWRSSQTPNERFPRAI